MRLEGMSDRSLAEDVAYIKAALPTVVDEAQRDRLLIALGRITLEQAERLFRRGAEVVNIAP